MKMRPPAIPLVTVDPYFSVWSFTDKLYDSDTNHWTGSANTIIGKVIVDNKEYRFMGKDSSLELKQIYFDMNSLVTTYKFSDGKICLNVFFYSTLFTDDLYRLSRPVSYVRFIYESIDGNDHEVSVRLSVSEEICLNKKKEGEVETELIETDSCKLIKIGNKIQNVLNASGDDIRINWGYFYLSAPCSGRCYSDINNEMTYVNTEFLLTDSKASTIVFAYDDIKSIDYFGYKADALWKKYDTDIITSVSKALDESEIMFTKCMDISAAIEKNAFCHGGEKYAELLALAYRQTIAAHKVALDSDDNVIFISKECFSNGCAATVDVTYPSSPFFLLYNTELLKGMLRPVFKFAASEEWQFDFAPHDVGQYPLVLGQVYGKNHEADGRYEEFQMPVEECGNMLIMMTNITLVEKNTEFFDLYSDVLDKWVRYLVEYGMDPANQLCTDDFAGHLAHNCNLSLKAIMGILGYSIILELKKDSRSAEYRKIAQAMADNWVEKAGKPDGSFSLTFDTDDTFSLKYNMIWDKFWKTGLFAPSVYNSEFCSYSKHMNPYGIPLDNRKDYTKSDWILWTACLAPYKEDFEKFIYPLWECYNVTPSRVPMTDWYDTVTSMVVGFRHRSVQGGLFIKLFEDFFKQV